MNPNAPERRSNRPRNTGGTRARLEELGEILAAPTHKKRTAVAAPTSGDRGRALASQNRSKKKNTAPPQAPIPPFVPAEYNPNRAPQTSVYATIPPMSIPAATSALSGSLHAHESGDEDDGNGGSEDPDADGEEDDEYMEEFDETLKAPPPTQLLQSLSLSGTSDVQSYGNLFTPSGETQESMLDLLNSDDLNWNLGSAPSLRTLPVPSPTLPLQLPQDPVINASNSISASNDPSWVADPVPPGSTIFRETAQPVMHGRVPTVPTLFEVSDNVTNTVDAYHRRRGQIRPPDPRDFGTFRHPTPTLTPNRGPVSHPYAHAYAHTSSRASSQSSFGSSHVSSHTSCAPTTSTTSAWTISSQGSTGPIRFRRRRRQVDLPQSHSTLTETERVIVRAAQDILTTEILCDNAFPSKEELRAMAIRVYDQALNRPDLYRLGAPLYPSAIALKAIRATCSVIRNYLKRICMDVVPRQYQLLPLPQLPEFQQRQEISAAVRNLTTKGAYSQDPNPHGDKYFAHPAAYEIVKQLLYDPRKGLARGKQANFNPFPLECIALIYTGILATIDSHKTGTQVPFDFSRRLNYPRFIHIKSQLEKIQSMPGRRKERFEKVRVKLFDMQNEVSTSEETGELFDDYFDDNSDSD